MPQLLSTLSRPFPDATVLAIDYTDYDRILSHRKINEETGCWNYTLCKDGFGYGMVRVRTVDGKWVTRRVHRVVAQILGVDLSSFEVLRHSCDNPSCFNPDHLEPGTHADNAHDRDLRGRHIVLLGEDHGMSVLTDVVVREIRDRVSQGESSYDVAEDTGVSYSQVRRVATGKAWKHVKECDGPSYNYAIPSFS